MKNALMVDVSGSIQLPNVQEIQTVKVMKFVILDRVLIDVL